ncbi:kxDL motif-containing protein CG10681 [Trichoplusia ni]|uniref:KxDL motif-containing protein CG10681 n=1 Tax=Trichoplusia ni TaxID=7111 RepID=A0A7E5VK33_TRINI|nr:kxDL motif-containing protein CG10681 [Trichoplusia ni]XP_026728566.1 kxDL motif-containing protein CG10681 [Trichoplusia ni]
MANDTPESDFSIECFQNYSAPEVFVQGLAGMVNQNDVETVIRAQKNMLQRFEKTTEMLTNCNQLSASRLRAASTEFKKHTQLLLEMRKDLEFIFKKIRAIKTKLSTQYPEAYKTAVAASIANRRPVDDDDDEEFKPSSVMDRPESKMVATVSTETLKPTTSESGKKSKKKDQSDESNNNQDASVASEEKLKDVGRKKRNSSSSDTESASSGDDCSTDTG